MLLGCFGMLLGCFGMLWDALGCFGMLWDVLGCFGTLWDALDFINTKFRDAALFKKMGGGTSNEAGMICPPWSKKGRLIPQNLGGGAHAPPLPPDLRRLCQI